MGKLKEENSQEMKQTVEDAPPGEFLPDKKKGEVQISTRGWDAVQATLDIANRMVSRVEALGNTIYTEEFYNNLSSTELVGLYKISFDNMLKAMDFVRKVSVSKLLLQNDEAVMLLNKIQKLSPGQLKELSFYIAKVERQA